MAGVSDVPVHAFRAALRRLRCEAAVAPSDTSTSSRPVAASDASTSSRLAAARARSLDLGPPRRRGGAAAAARARREHPELFVAPEPDAEPAPPPPVDDGRWAALEVAVARRGDLAAGCPICLGPFSGFADAAASVTVLLDCAHAYHATCLAALERHLGVGNRRCALCRRQNYAKRRTTAAVPVVRAAAAAAIARAARAMVARARTDKARRAFYGAGRGEMGARRAYLAGAVRAHGNRLATADAASEDALDALFAESDGAVALARAALAAAFPPRPASPQRPSAEVWAAAEARAARRAEAFCAVCLGPLALRGSMLLPCSHEFHAACVDAMERFRPGGGAEGAAEAAPTCPVCRTPYRERRAPVGAAPNVHVP